MIFCIADVLTSEQLKAVKSVLCREKFNDGRSTAGWAARDVKKNLQMQSKTQSWTKVQRILLDAIKANDVFNLAAGPKLISPLMISKYESGMSYGNHVDNAVMNGEKPMRSDLSFTLFLSGPEEYEGGDLAVEDSQGVQTFKLPAGALLLYPSTSVHRVETVTHGERMVAVGWVQSLVRESERRQILFDLETLRRQVFSRDGKTEEFDILSKTASNLWRMWSDL